MNINQPLLYLVIKYTKDRKKTCTSAQTVLTWEFKGGDFIVFISEMRKEERIKEKF